RGDFGDAPSQEAALRLALGELEGAFVLLARLVSTAEAAEQVGARRVKVLVAVEVEPLDKGEPRFGPVRLGHGDRAIQLHDRRPGQPDELSVQGGDLWPVVR